MSSPNFTAIRDNARQKLLGQFAHYQQRGKSLEFVCHLSQLLADLPVIPGVTSGKDLLRKVQNKELNGHSDCRADLNATLNELSQIPDIQEVEDLQNKLQRNVRSVVFITRAREIEEEGVNVAFFKSELLSRRKVPSGVDLLSLIPEQRYASQRTIRGNGSGFLYTDGKQYYVITAAHVLTATFGNCDIFDLRFVSSEAFSVRQNPTNGLDAHLFNRRVTIRKDLLLKPASEELRFKWSYNGADIAIIPVEAVTENARIADLSPYFEALIDDKLEKADYFKKIIIEKPETESEEVPDEEQSEVPPTFNTIPKQVYALGHGLGLPLKLSPCGEITKYEPGRSTYDAKLDVFAGNSGSPVFDSETHMLVGMLVRGKRNVFFDQTKNKVKIRPNRPDANRDGEEFISTALLQELLKQVPTSWPCSLNFSSELVKPTSNLDEVYQLLPFTYLAKDTNNKYRLRIILDASQRRVVFSQPTFIDQVCLIDCALVERKEGQEDYATNLFDVTIPSSGSSQTPDSNNSAKKSDLRRIVIRVRDLKNKNTYVSVLNYANCENGVSPTDDLMDRFHFAIFLPPLVSQGPDDGDVHYYGGRIDGNHTVFNRSIKTVEIKARDLDTLELELWEPESGVYELWDARDHEKPKMPSTSRGLFPIPHPVASFPKPTGNDGRVQPSHQFLI